MPPIPPAVAIPALANLFGAGINAASTSHQNMMSQRFARDMYQLQKQDALDFWNLQNEYNSPQAQMMRLQEAGLNPNLIYGGSSGGAAGTASPIKTPDVQSAQFRTPMYGDLLTQMMPMLSAFYDIEIKQATVDAVKSQTNVRDKEALLKEAQIGSVLTGTDRAAFDLEFEKELRGVSADFRREQLRKLQIESRFQLDENERRMAANAVNVRQGLESILNSRLNRARTREEIKRLKQAIRGVQLDNTLKQLDIELRRAGINPNDSMFVRILGRIANYLTEEGAPKNSTLFKLFNPEKFLPR